MRRIQKFIMLSGLGGGEVFPSPVAYWPLEETGATAARIDVTGRGNNLTNVDRLNVAAVVGKIGNCAQRQAGKPAWAGCAATADLALSGASFTIAGWLKAASVAVGSGRYLLSKASATKNQLHVKDVAHYLTMVIVDTVGSKTVTSLVELNITDFFFFALGYDLAAQKIFISVNNETKVLTATSGGPASDAGDFNLFNFYTRIVGISWDDIIDEVGVWPVAFTQSQISYLYNGGSGRTYPFDPGTNWVFYMPYGDSKTNSVPWSAAITAARPLWVIKPDWIGVSGRTNASAKLAIDAELAARTDIPAHILYNLGVNDALATGDMTSTEAVWKANVAYIWEAMHAKWPSVIIYVMYPWRQGQDADCNLMATWYDALRATRTTWVKQGPDERVWLEGGDDGATMSSDGIHYSAAGIVECSAQWLAILP
jgi:hypothetical protein